MTTLYWLHFVFLGMFVAAVAALFWLARLYDRG